MNYKEWLASAYQTKRTVQNYYRAVYGDRINERLYQITGSDLPLYAETNLNRLKTKVDLLLNDPVFKDFDAVGHRMYSCGLNAFLNYRQALITKDFLAEDLRIIETSLDIKETQKATLIQARVGQGEYKRKLLNMWSSQCAVTGYADERFLIASHIKPWRLATNIERLDINNGLILTPNLDKAFDRGLITFAPQNGQIIISRYLPKPEMLGITPELSLRYLPSGLKNYLEFHEQSIFLNVIS